jgi:nicotinamide phosphoribosyltransferase
MANTEQQEVYTDNQIDPNKGPMRIDGEPVFRSEYEKMTQSIPFYTDSYKPSMDPQYPPEVETVHSYGESRGAPVDHVMMAGNQVFVDKLAEGTNMREVNFAREYWAAHGVPFPYEMWKTIVKEYGGRIPLTIRAVPEGILIPPRNPLVTVENNGGRATRALTTWVETMGLSYLWYMSTVATNDYYLRQTIGKYYELSVDAGLYDPGRLFRDHDFGWRGVAPGAGIYGGGAHTFNSLGTDTFGSIPFMCWHYGAAPNEVGFSIPAMEHSTVTSWGKDRENDAFLNMTEIYAHSSRPYAMVIDSYDPERAVEWITNPDGPIVKILKERNAICVLRPDSGNPTELLPKLAQIVARNVGYTTNKKGYKIFNYFRFIWGDGITHEVINRIENMMVSIMGFSAENFAFGQGGAKLQLVGRDDLQFAYKCSAVRLTHGSWRNVYKQPAGILNKNSKMGLVETFVLDPSNWEYDDILYVRDIRDTESIERLKLVPLMETVFENGIVEKRWTIKEVRANTERIYKNAPQGHSAGVYPPLV